MTDKEFEQKLDELKEKRLIGTNKQDEQLTFLIIIAFVLTVILIIILTLH